MRRTAFAVCAVVLTCTGSRPARADNAAATRRAIRAAYNKMDAAYARKDVAGAVAYMTADYTETWAVPPVHGRAEKVAQVRQAVAECKSIRVKSVTDSIRIAGRTATVMVSNELRLVAVRPQDHTAHRLVITEWDRDTWVRAGQGWKISRSDEVQLKVLMDGKLVPHSP